MEIRLPSGSWENWDALTEFPKLTHGSVEGTIQSQDVSKLLQDCSTLLELLVVVPLIPFHQRQDLEARAQKPIFLMQFLIGREARMEVWMWRFAELVVFARESEYFRLYISMLRC